MENITTYYATRKNIFVWLAALLCLVSAVARIAFACLSDIGGMDMFVRIILFVAANLLIAIRLPWRGEKQFYVTVIPVVLITLILMISGIKFSNSIFMTILCIILSLIFAAVYFLTFTGKLKTKWIAFIIALGIVVALAMDKTLSTSIPNVNGSGKYLVISDAATILGIIITILSARKMAPWKEGDPYRLRFGDRLDGRRVRNMPVMSKVTPFFMPTRLGRSNQIHDTVEVSNMEQYIHCKRKEGLNHFGIQHVIVASYVRAIADYPELNRFVAGQRIYHRYELSLNMVVKKEMVKDAPDSSIKVLFDPHDTAKDVYEKFDAAVQVAREEGIANGYDSITHVLDYLPSIVMSLFGLLMRVLDYFSIMPMALEKVSPFHGSLFITSMGSLGIPPIYHHLYDFGTVPVFIAFGHKYTKHEANKNGEIVTRKYLDYKVVCDEGICDGFYYASAMKKMRGYITHPEKLDLPPEKVVEDIM